MEEPITITLENLNNAVDTILHIMRDANQNKAIGESEEATEERKAHARVDGGIANIAMIADIALLQELGFQAKAILTESGNYFTALEFEGEEFSIGGVRDV